MTKKSKHHMKRAFKSIRSSRYICENEDELKERTISLCKLKFSEGKLLQQPQLMLITEPTRRLNYCHVPKAASTSWMMGFRAMNGYDEEDQSIGDVHQKMINKHSIKLDVSDQALMEKAKRSLKSTFTFTMVRHPFERLLSCYLDKFLKKRDPLFIQPVFVYNGDNVMNFEKFIRFVINEIQDGEFSHGSLHWWPFTDLCQMCHYPYNFVGTLENFQEDVDCVVNKFPDFPELQLMKNVAEKKMNSIGQHPDSKRYFHELPMDLKKQLYDIYKYDFLLGNYPYPNDYM